MKKIISLMLMVVMLFCMVTVSIAAPDVSTLESTKIVNVVGKLESISVLNGNFYVIVFILFYQFCTKRNAVFCILKNLCTLHILVAVATGGQQKVTLQKYICLFEHCNNFFSCHSLTTSLIFSKISHASRS